MQPDLYRPPTSPLRGGESARPLRLHALAAGSLTTVLASLAVDATVSNASLPLTLGILVGIATAGGFVAAWLGRPRHTLHAALTGGSFALFVFGMVVRLSRPSLYELLSVLDALAGFVAVLVGASVCGGWLARALTRPPSGMRGGKRKR